MSDLDVPGLAQDHIERLAGVSRVLSVRLANLPADLPKLAVQWRKANTMLMELWGRLAPSIDWREISTDADDASAAEVKRGKSLITMRYAEETVTELQEQRSVVTVSLSEVPRGTRNRVLFYIDREIGEVQRIFRL